MADLRQSDAITGEPLGGEAPQPVPESGGLVDPGVTAPESPMEEAAPAAVQPATSTVVSPPAENLAAATPTEEADPLKLAQQYISPELYSTLEKAASPKTTLGDAFARTGLAITSPELYKQAMDLDQASSTNARNALVSLQAQAVQHDKAMRQQAAYNQRAEQANWRMKGSAYLQSARDAGTSIPPQPGYGTPEADEWEGKTQVALDEGYRAQASAKRKGELFKQLGPLIVDHIKISPPEPGGEERWLQGVLAIPQAAGQMTPEEADAMTQDLIDNGGLAQMVKMTYMEQATGIAKVEAETAKIYHDMKMAEALLPLQYQRLEVLMKQAGGLAADKAAGMVAEITGMQSGLLDSMKKMEGLIQVAQGNPTLEKGIPEYQRVQGQLQLLYNQAEMTRLLAISAAEQAIGASNLSGIVSKTVQMKAMEFEAQMGLPNFAAWASQNREHPASKAFWGAVMNDLMLQTGLSAEDALQTMNEIAMQGGIYPMWKGQDVVPDIPTEGKPNAGSESPAGSPAPGTSGPPK